MNKNNKVELRKRVRKPRMSLVPPYSLAMVANAFEDGANKYGRANYLEGGKVSDYEDAHDRHMGLFRSGENFDPETGVHHLAAAIVNLMIILEAMARGSLEDDRAPYVSPRSAYPFNEEEM